MDYGMNAPAKEYDGVNKYIRITDIDENSSEYNCASIVSPDGTLLDKYLVNENDILFARTGSSTGKAYLYRPTDGRLYFAGFLIRANVKDDNESNFIYHQCKLKRYWNWVRIMSARSGQPGINSQEYSTYTIYSTSKEEQIKISSLLNLLDERIATQRRLIEDLEKLKSAIRKKVFANMKNLNTEDFEINDLLIYEQPNSYIVTCDEYIFDSTKTPVLTANKGFILGYTEEVFGIYQKGNCIIFDDFTMDAKYVTFPFKVKSSAIKILTAKPNVNLRFMFEYLQSMELKSEEHKRHYLSEISTLVLSIPTINMQNRIAYILDSIDSKIVLEQQIAEKYKKEKRYLLSNMFI